MAKLYIFTQNYENYGDEENPHWKAKGGTDYFVYDFDGDEATTIMLVRDQIECDNPFYRSQIAGWEVVPNNYLTEFEQDQLDYEGSIRFPARVISATK
jgi:hypothetical protein